MVAIPTGEDIVRAVKGRADLCQNLGVRMQLGTGSAMWDASGPVSHTYLELVRGIADAYQAKLQDLEDRIAALENP